MTTVRRGRKPPTRDSKPRMFAALGIAAPCSVALVVPSTAGAATSPDKTRFSVIAGSLAFSTVPAMPLLTNVTLNGGAQTTNTTMTDLGVQDATGSGSGWNVTVNGTPTASSTNSPVFAQYCTTTAPTNCGTDVAQQYVTGGQTLPANSLTLNSTGAGFTAQSGSTGTAPTLLCNSGCSVDSAAATRVASAALNAGMGTYITNTLWSATSLSLATPSTMKALPANEAYRVNLTWTLTSGP